MWNSMSVIPLDNNIPLNDWMDFSSSKITELSLSICKRALYYSYKTDDVFHNVYDLFQIRFFSSCLITNSTMSPTLETKMPIVIGINRLIIGTVCERKFYNLQYVLDTTWEKFPRLIKVEQVSSMWSNWDLSSSKSMFITWKNGSLDFNFIQNAVSFYI